MDLSKNKQWGERRAFIKFSVTSSLSPLSEHIHVKRTTSTTTNHGVLVPVSTEGFLYIRVMCF